MTPLTLPPAPAQPQPAAPQPAYPPMPCDVFCTVERHPAMVRPQGSVMSLAG